MGKINGFFGHKTRKQAKRIYLLCLQILPLERNTMPPPPPRPKQHRVLLFYMEKARPLAKFRSYLAEVSREREVWSQSLALSSPNPPLIPLHSH